MASITVKTLRHAFPAVLSSLQQTERVTITRRGRAVATLSAIKPRRGQWTPPDFAARARDDFHNRFTALSLIEQLHKSAGR